MRLLLDTHALLWLLQDDERLSRRALTVLASANVKLISAVSTYEICLKHALGKWPEAAALAGDFEREVVALDGVPLPVSLAHAAAAGRLPLAHRDPFDRLLAAQALVEGVPIVSADPAFDQFGVERFW